MHSFLVAIYSYFLSPLLTLLLFLIFGYVIMSWLIAFGVVSTRNQTVRQIQYALDSVMLPLLRPIQRYVPPDCCIASPFAASPRPRPTGSRTGRRTIPGGDS